MMTGPGKKKTPKSMSSAIVAKAAGIERDTFVSTIATLAGAAYDGALQPQAAGVTCTSCFGAGRALHNPETSCAPCGGTGKVNE